MVKITKIENREDIKNAPKKYKEYTRRKLIFCIFFIILICIISLYSISTGSMNLSIGEVINGLAHSGDINEVVIWNIRLPRIIGAIIAGISLAVAGVVMQCILRNPLASPFTMGISHGAVFGAAFAIIVLGAGELHRTGTPLTLNNPYSVTIFAFIGALIGVFIILLLAKLRGLTPEAMILAGVAMSSLFGAGTMLLQYFAEDVKVASIVFWTFGDIGRAGWTDIKIMLFITIPALIYFIYKRWDYNALESGGETAKSLGVNTERTRLVGMIIAALITSVCVAFLGIIGFVGLVVPHIMRMIIGGDYRYLIPISAIFGGLLLLVADTVARTIILPVTLPVGVLTSFIGAPMFIYILVKRYKRK